PSAEQQAEDDERCGNPTKLPPRVLSHFGRDCLEERGGAAPAAATLFPRLIERRVDQAHDRRLAHLRRDRRPGSGPHRTGSDPLDDEHRPPGTESDAVTQSDRGSLPNAVAVQKGSVLAARVTERQGA